jgi:hypothetical protein
MVGHAPAERSQRFDEQRERLRSRYLKAKNARPPSSGRGPHHAALATSGRFRDYTSTWNEHRFEGIASYYAERIVINGERRTRGCIPRG